MEARMIYVTNVSIDILTNVFFPVPPTILTSFCLEVLILRRKISKDHNVIFNKIKVEMAHLLF